MNDTPPVPRVDMHVHVGLIGDTWPGMGRISDAMRQTLTWRVFLLYMGLEPGQARDETLHDAALRTIRTCGVDHVVCLALAPVFDDAGNERKDLSTLWVANDYITRLRHELGPKVLVGASVHPYDPRFRERVSRCVEEDDAVLLKWLPSAQQIDLADPRVRAALEFLASAGPGGGPLPLLLHVGPEHAIITSDPRTTSRDFLSWDWRDGLWNLFRPRAKRWHVPRLEQLHANLRAGLDAGACIIFAHCGLPYFAPRFLRWAEHTDFAAVKRYLVERGGADGLAGRCFADVSAIVTPFRRSYFADIAKLPPRSLLAGSDCPTPVFELSAGPDEFEEDFRAVMNGHLERVVVPEDNLIDVHWRELEHAFPRHAMFRNGAFLAPRA